MYAGVCVCVRECEHTHTNTNTCIHKIHTIHKNVCARGVMVIVVGNEHGDTSSNPGRD